MSMVLQQQSPGLGQQHSYHGARPALGDPSGMQGMQAYVQGQGTRGMTGAFTPQSPYAPLTPGASASSQPSYGSSPPNPGATPAAYGMYTAGMQSTPQTPMGQAPLGHSSGTPEFKFDFNFGGPSSQREEPPALKPNPIYNTKFDFSKTEIPTQTTLGQSPTLHGDRMPSQTQTLSPPQRAQAPQQEPQQGGVPRGWQPLPQIPGQKVRQLQSLHEESIVTFVSRLSAERKGQMSPHLPAPPPAPATSMRQRATQDVYGDGREGKSSSSRRRSSSPMSWFWKNLEAWTGLTELCMQTQDQPKARAYSPGKQHGTFQPLRPAGPPGGAPLSSVRSQPPAQGSHMQRPTWCARSAPGLTAASQSGCQPAPFRGSRADDSAGNGAERAMSPMEVAQALSSSRTAMCSLKGNKDSAPNQDRAFCLAMGCGAELFGVFDGHGVQGHTAAEISCEILPKLLLHGLARCGFPGALSQPELQRGQEWKEVVGSSFEELHWFTEMLTSMLPSHAAPCTDDLNLSHQEWMQLDARASGTTATVVMLLPRQRAIVAHVGDSRAVLAKRRKGYGPWSAIELTRDHKPDAQDERMRIEASGAQIYNAGNNHISVIRVVTPGQPWPSINMSRSIGDLHAHTQGLSAKAEVNILDRLWDPSSEDAVLIVASDGIWDVFDGAAAAELVSDELANGNDPATSLSNEALDRWMRRGLSGNYSDDISVVVKFL